MVIDISNMLSYDLFCIFLFIDKFLKFWFVWNPIVQIQQEGIFQSFEQFVREFRKKGQLYKLKGRELTEIDNLIKKTWVQQFVGAGRDASNLNHTSIQV